MASHRTRKCDKFNLKLLGSILAGAVHFVRKETHSDNVMPYKTSQIAGIFYMQIGTHKSAKKTTFALSDFVLLLVCHIGRFVLNKNAKKPFVAICFGFREKIASLTGLYSEKNVLVRPMTLPAWWDLKIIWHKRSSTQDDVSRARNMLRA